MGTGPEGDSEIDPNNPFFAVFKQHALENPFSELIQGVEVLQTEVAREKTEENAQVLGHEIRLMQAVRGAIVARRAAVLNLSNRASAVVDEGLANAESAISLIQSYEQLGSDWYKLRVRGFAPGTTSQTLRDRYVQMGEEVRLLDPTSQMLCWKALGHGQGIKEGIPNKEPSEFIHDVPYSPKFRPEVRELMNFLQKDPIKKKGIMLHAAFFILANIDLMDDASFSSFDSFAKDPDNNSKIRNGEGYIDRESTYPVFNEWFGTISHL